MNEKEDQLRFLAKAGRMLSESLNYEATVANTVHLIVPEIADGCVVRFLENGVLKIATARHKDPEKQKQLNATGIELKISELPPGLVSFLERGEPYILSDASQLEFNVPHVTEIFSSLGVKSYAIVPLKIHGRSAGTVSFYSDASNRTFRADDAAFFKSIATRISLSVENARLYAEARRAAALREEMVTIVSHDLRTPLAAIQLGAQLLQRHSPPELSEESKSRMDVCLKSIVGSSRTALALVNDLLDLTKMESGRLEVDKVQVSLEHLMSAVAAVFEIQAQAKDIRFVIDYEADELVCDPERVIEVLSNLLGNALKFTAAGGSVCLSSKSDASKILFTVTDTGPGIEKRDLQHIFDRYWQVSKTKRLGSGLGLAIAKGIVESHGGRIWAESEVGKGSCFFFEIPKAPKTLTLH